MLYDMTDGSLRKVPGTTFKEEKVLERTHLQAGVRDHIEVLGGWCFSRGGDPVKLIASGE